MNDSDMRVLHVPLHKELCTELETAMSDEQSKSSSPLVLESYICGILSNFAFNYKFQKTAAEYEKNLQGEIRNKIIRWTDSTIRALALEKK